MNVACKPRYSNVKMDIKDFLPLDLYHQPKNLYIFLTIVNRTDLSRLRIRSVITGCRISGVFVHMVSSHRRFKCV